MGKVIHSSYIRWIETRFSRVAFSRGETIFVVAGIALFILMANQEYYLAVLAWLAHRFAFPVHIALMLHWTLFAMAVAAVAYTLLKLTLPLFLKLTLPLKRRID